MGIDQISVGAIPEIHFGRRNLHGIHVDNDRITHRSGAAPDGIGAEIGEDFGSLIRLHRPRNRPGHLNHRIVGAGTAHGVGDHHVGGNQGFVNDPNIRLKVNGFGINGPLENRARIGLHFGQGSHDGSLE